MYSEIKTLFELDGVCVDQSDVIGFVFLQKSTLLFAVQQKNGTVQVFQVTYDGEKSKCVVVLTVEGTYSKFEMYFDTRAKNICALDQALLVFNGEDRCLVRTINSVVYEQHNTVVKHASHRNNTICLLTQ